MRTLNTKLIEGSFLCFATRMKTLSSFTLYMPLLIIWSVRYRRLVGRYVKWIGDNHLLPNAVKIKEMVMDFRRNRTTLRPLGFLDKEVEFFEECTYLLPLTVNWLRVPKALLSRYQGSDPSMFAARCWRSSTSLLRPAPSYPVWSAGEPPSQWHLLIKQTDQRTRLLSLAVEELRALRQWWRCVYPCNNLNYIRGNR